MTEDGYVDSKYPLTGQTPEPAEELSDESVLVYMWRFSELWGAGYDSVVAEILAHTDADLHKMCDAKQAGMTDQQALRVFA